jgi:hypothetical protein
MPLNSMIVAQRGCVMALYVLAGDGSMSGYMGNLVQVDSMDGLLLS